MKTISLENVMRKNGFRYCRNCEKETWQNATTADEHDFAGFARVFFAITSMGITEVMREPVWECEVCRRMVRR